MLIVYRSKCATERRNVAVKIISTTVINGKRLCRPRQGALRGEAHQFERADIHLQEVGNEFEVQDISD